MDSADRLTAIDLVWISFFMLYQVFAMFNDIVYAVGAYFLYVEWKTNPTGAGTASPVPPPI